MKVEWDGLKILSYHLLLSFNKKMNGAGEVMPIDFLVTC